MTKLTTSVTRSATTAVTSEDLRELAQTSVGLLADAVTGHRYPDDNLYSAVESASFAALITAARDLHLAAHGLASGKGLSSEEVRGHVQDALDAAALVSQRMGQTARSIAH